MNILLLIAILAAWLVLSLLVASHVGKLLAYARQCVEGVYAFHAHLNRNAHSIANG